MAARTLIDANVLVYRYDHRFPKKQSTASAVLRECLRTGVARVPHQAVVEFVAATTRGRPGQRLLEPADARREAEELMAQFTVVYPEDAVLRTALRGAAALRPVLVRRTPVGLRRSPQPV